MTLAVLYLVGAFGDENGRFFTPRTPAELVEEMNGKTSIAQKAIIKRHKGHWMTVEGDLAGADYLLWGVLASLRSTQTQPSIMLRFLSPKWRKAFKPFNEGDRIRVTGQVDNADHTWVTLRKCEIVPLEKTDVST